MDQEASPHFVVESHWNFLTVDGFACCDGVGPTNGFFMSQVSGNNTD